VTDQSEQKIYERIVADIAAKISNGEYLPGAKIPSERELMDSYDVSASPARKALQMLRDSGLVDIRPASGAYVRDWQPILRDATRRLSREHWGSGKSIQSADLGDRLPPTPDNVAVRREAADPERAALLGDDELVVRSRRYSVEGRPVQLAVSYLPAGIAGGTEIERKDTGPGGTYARLAELGHEPVAFRERVTSRAPSADEAKQLQLARGVWVFEITRHASEASGRVIEETVMVLDAASYVLQYSFTS
jgi:GntR family transcriptional regulator